MNDLDFVTDGTRKKTVLEETIQEIEDWGKALKQRKDQQIWSIDEEQGEAGRVEKEERRGGGEERRRG